MTLHNTSTRIFSLNSLALGFFIIASGCAQTETVEIEREFNAPELSEAVAVLHPTEGFEGQIPWLIGLRLLRNSSPISRSQRTTCRVWHLKSVQTACLQLQRHRLGLLPTQIALMRCTREHPEYSYNYKQIAAVLGVKDAFIRKRIVTPSDWFFSKYYNSWIKMMYILWGRCLYE